MAIMALPIVIALPGNARQPQRDGNTALAAMGEISGPDSARQLHKGPRGRQVRVGLYENKPKVFTAENGRPSGIFIELLNDIAQKEKWELVYVPCEWPACLSALEEGRIDLMPDIAFSPERDRNLDFHEEQVIESWSQVYAHQKSPVSKLSDLNGRRLALLQGSIQQPVLEQMIKGFGYEISLVEAHSYEEAFALAAGGTVDAVVANHFFGNYYCQEYGLVKTSIVFNPVSLYFATASGANQDLLEAIDRNLRAMKAEPGSAFYSVLAHWMERPPKVVVPRYLVWITGGIGGSLVLAFAVILLLRRQVMIRTRHLAQANETLRESEEKFRNLFQNHLAVKLIIDPDNGNIIEANEAAEKFYGWSGEQLRSKRIQDIIDFPPGQDEGEMVKAGQCIHCELLRHRLADGSLRDVEVFSSRIDIKGKTLLHFIIHDITEHRKLEEQYRQAQKMEAVGQLAGGVAHDYNNMLSVILGYAELAMDKTSADDPRHGDLKEIINAASRSRNITQQLLAFARKQTISPRVCDLNQSVEAMLKMLQRLIGEEIDLAWLPAAGWPVKIDPTQVDQILVNLCVNARDAITGVGKVTIETGNVTFDEAYCAAHAGFAAGEFVVLAVSDDGCGMQKETVDNIFEPFFTTKDTGRGTGLGLSTVYGIVKQNHGFINVYSEPGKGTTFKIHLPRHAYGTEEKHAGSATEAQPSRGETILLVEDEVAVLKLARRMLEDLGYTVLVAVTPGEVMDLVGKHPGGIHLLITDVVMPEMTGPDLAEKLHVLYPGLRILFMSGYTTNAMAHHHGVPEDEVRFIQKPFSKKELAAKVREVLNEG